MTRQPRALSMLRDCTKWADPFLAALSQDEEIQARVQLRNIVLNRRAKTEDLAAFLSSRFKSVTARLTVGELFELDLSDAKAVRDALKKKNEELPGRWISSREAARLLGKTTSTLAKLRSQGRGPTGWRQTTPTTVMYPLESVLECRSSLGIGVENEE